MMATVQVVREPTPAQMQVTVVRDGGLAISSAHMGRGPNCRLRACCCTSAESGLTTSHGRGDLSLRRGPPWNQ